MSSCVVGISGGTCAGKTTLARVLAAHFAPHCAVVSQDWYYRPLDVLPAEMRARVNFDAPDAVDALLLASQVAALSKGHAVEAPQYDFALHTRRPETLPVAPAPIILVEGLHVIGMPELSDLLSLRVFVEAPDMLRLARRLGRDTRERGRTEAQVVAQFEATVRPMHARFVAPLAMIADVVVDGSAISGPAVGSVVERIVQMPHPFH